MSYQILRRDEVLDLIVESDLPFYVYLLIDEKNQPFYVGKGISARVLAHEAEALSERNVNEKHQVIRECWKSVGIRYKIAAFFETDDEAHREERRLIQHYGRRDLGTGILTNLSDGGEGHSRIYPPEQWLWHDDDTVVAKEIEFPSESQLEAPRLMKGGLARPRWNPNQGEWSFSPEDSEKLENERRKPSGLEMQCLAFWQHGGWTIQVFWDDSSRFDPAAIVQNGGARSVRMRFFDGATLLLYDSIRVTARTLVMPRRLVARVLRAMSCPNTINGHTRICVRSSTVDFSKRLKMWCFHRSEELRNAADGLDKLNVEPPVIVTSVAEDERSVMQYVLQLDPHPELYASRAEFERLALSAWRTFREFGLAVKHFARLDQHSWQGLVFYNWAGFPKIDASSVDYSSGGPVIRLNWSCAAMSRKQIIEKWNTEFPNMTIPPWDQGGGPAVVDSAVRDLVRTIADIFDNQQE